MGLRSACPTLLIAGEPICNDSSLFAKQSTLAPGTGVMGHSGRGGVREDGVVARPALGLPAVRRQFAPLVGRQVALCRLLRTEGIDGYRYSPAFAVAFTPLAYLPARLGTMIWNMAGIALLVCALHVLVRDVLPGDWPPQRERGFLTLTLAGSAVGIWSGQSNAIITAAIILALAAIVRQRWWAASILLAVPVFIKIWPLAIVMLLVVFWPRKLAWRLAVVCAVLALVPFLTRPPSTVAWQYREWYNALTGPLQGRWTGYRDAWTIWEQLSSAGQCATPTVAIQLAAAWAVLGWCWWQYRRLTSVGQTFLSALKNRRDRADRMSAPSSAAC